MRFSETAHLRTSRETNDSLPQHLRCEVCWHADQEAMGDQNASPSKSSETPSHSNTSHGPGKTSMLWQAVCAVVRRCYLWDYRRSVLFESVVPKSATSTFHANLLPARADGECPHANGNVTHAAGHTKMGTTRGSGRKILQEPRRLPRDKYDREPVVQVCVCFYCIL